ncbi:MULTISPECIES: DUF411 domain-containing protein [unclassified Cupriavidus]|uniref:DUF411 domain-containing protein n=1 Tax=unclassified Cupriavidus TaxID=2640874 RepID=UPI0010F5EE1B|nr:MULTISPECIES: DUF411 domain-containing protein [unclassified Cupriavidus]MWL87005.1 DUF411 domain-containing protein [Cupriavidus sp. SW-Y-13]
MKTRRDALRTLGAGALMLSPLVATAQSAKPLAIVVYKTPTCGCCGDWVKHLQDNGFTVTTHDVEDTGPYRQKYGIPERFGSCHTGVIAGYGIEGHVPAADIKKLVATKPKATGLAVPGMPVGSPGMEMGPRKDPFDVLLVKADGAASVFSSYNKKA